MGVSSEYEAYAAAIGDLFAATFTASEGTDEGALIGQLARRLMAETPAQDLRTFTGWKRGQLVGAILFSRLIYTGYKRTVFVLGPVAVATDRQNQGIGQRLISHGIEVLRQEGVELAVIRAFTDVSASRSSLKMMCLRLFPCNGLKAGWASR